MMGLALVLCACALLLGVAAHQPFSEPERLRSANWGADSWAGGTEDEDFSMESPFDILAASVDCSGKPRPRESIAVAALLSHPGDVDWYLLNKTTGDAEVGAGHACREGCREQGAPSLPHSTSCPPAAPVCPSALSQR